MKLIATAIALIATCTSLCAQAVVKTVAQYDENFLNLNTPDLINVALPVTYANFNTAVTAGFPLNKSGVINFDQPQSITPFPALGINTIKGLYGAGMINTMLVSFGNPVNMQNTMGPQIPISNKGLLNQPLAAPLVFKLTPSNALPTRLVGFTVLQQQNAQLIKAEFIQAGGPTLVANQLVPVAAIPTKDAFIARAATVPGGIVAVQITVTIPGTTIVQKFAIDDLAFRQ
jgi:hypothetical protein